MEENTATNAEEMPEGAQEMAISPEDELMYAAIEEAARRIFEETDFALVGVIETIGAGRDVVEIGAEAEAEALAVARRAIAERDAVAFAMVGLGSAEAAEVSEATGEEGDTEEIPVLVVYRQGSDDAQVELFIAPFSVGPDEDGDDGMEIGELESQGFLPESWLG